MSLNMFPMLKNKLIFPLLLLLAIASCKRTENTTYVLPKPLYELTDPAGKEAFYLVRDAGKNKEKLKKLFDSVANRIIVTDRHIYSHYSISFYRESDDVNERVFRSLDTTGWEQYDFFEDHDDNHIATYSYSHAQFIYTHWSKKYK